MDKIMKENINYLAILPGIVKKNGTGAHVPFPKKFVGHPVRVLVENKKEEEEEKRDKKEEERLWGAIRELQDNLFELEAKIFKLKSNL